MVFSSLLGREGRNPQPGQSVEPSMTSWWLRNRARADDAFGLLCLRGMLLNSHDPAPTLAVRVGDHERIFDTEEAFGALDADGKRIVEFHLVSHLLDNGPNTVTAHVLLSDGRQVPVTELTLDIDNDSALGRQVAQDLQEYGTPPIVGRVIDSTLFPFENGTAKAWFNADIDDDIPLSLDPAPDADAAMRHLLRWGYCVLHEQLPPNLVDRFKEELKAALETGELVWREGSSDRIHGAHQKLASARQVWLYPPVLDFLRQYYKDEPCACQTLTYVNGSEQAAHQDSIHLTPYPSGFMCGVWVALEDVRENSGELFVYPGSHRDGSLRAAALGLHKVVNDDYAHYVKFDEAVQKLIGDGGYEKLVYRPKAGHILVWHENLIHGGSPRLDKDRTRLSVVSHYFAKGSIGFYDSRGEAASLETLHVDGVAA